MTKVLLVEDVEGYIRITKEYLEERGVEVQVARNLEEVDELYEKNKDADAIILDGCLNSHRLNTSPFLKKVIADGFKNPIIACSSYNDLLLEDGATHACKTKSGVAEFALKILNIA